MKTLLKFAPLAFALALVGCQTTQPTNTAPTPPAVQSSSAPNTAVQVAPRQQTATVITLHLAQQQAEESLIAVDVGDGAALHALPQPVLTQNDIGRVSPVTANGRNFVMLEMNVQGIPKLQNITQQAQGHFLLLSVQGQLVSIAQIGEVISDGRLLVSTQSPEHTQAIIQLMRGS